MCCHTNMDGIKRRAFHRTYLIVDDGCLAATMCCEVPKWISELAFVSLHYTKPLIYQHCFLGIQMDSVTLPFCPFLVCLGDEKTAGLPFGYDLHVLFFIYSLLPDITSLHTRLSLCHSEY